MKHTTPVLILSHGLLALLMAILLFTHASQAETSSSLCSSADTTVCLIGP